MKPNVKVHNEVASMQMSYLRWYECNVCELQSNKVQCACAWHHGYSAQLLSLRATKHKGKIHNVKVKTLTSEHHRRVQNFCCLAATLHCTAMRELMQDQMTFLKTVISPSSAEQICFCQSHIQTKNDGFCTMAIC